MICFSTLTLCFYIFFSNYPATTEIYTLSLHDALPISHLIVRDDALLLYGFATEEERDLFLLLIGVQSVGPKMALAVRSEEHTSELQSRRDLVCRLLLEKKKKKIIITDIIQVYMP